MRIHRQESAWAINVDILREKELATDLVNLREKINAPRLQQTMLHGLDPDWAPAHHLNVDFMVPPLRAFSKMKKVDLIQECIKYRGLLQLGWDEEILGVKESIKAHREMNVSNDAE